MNWLQEKFRKSANAKVDTKLIITSSKFYYILLLAELINPSPKMYILLAVETFLVEVVTRFQRNNGTEGISLDDLEMIMGQYYSQKW